MTAKKRSRKSAGAKKAKSGQAESNQASTQAKQENGQPGRRKAQLVQTRLQLGKRSQQASQQVQVRSKQQAQVQSRQSRQQAQTQTEQRAPREAFPGLGAVVQQNMSALEAAVRQGSAAAQELEQALEARDGVSPLVQFLFGHAQQPHAQCESCFEFAGHVCTEASGGALAQKVRLE